jgi:hypothetical protein
MHLKKIPGSGGQMELTAIVEDRIVLLNCQLKVEEKVYNSVTQVQTAGDDEASSEKGNFCRSAAVADPCSTRVFLQRHLSILTILFLLPPSLPYHPLLNSICCFTIDVFAVKSFSCVQASVRAATERPHIGISAHPQHGQSWQM